MRLVVTGGGTGGHVYPALEVARYSREQGASLLYLGSLRGQEGGVCQREGIDFRGFGSQPLYSLKTPRGWKALISLLKATGSAKRALRDWKPDAVFSTGGYSAAPVMAAARSQGVPYVIHESNSIPGRSNLMFAPQASAFTCLFKKTVEVIPNARRVGQPIRRELVAAAAGRAAEGPLRVLVVGGSQGAQFLNSTVPVAYKNLANADLEVIHATGPNNVEEVEALVKELGLGSKYMPKPYLNADEIAEAYRTATLAIGRSGGTIAEFALFKLPSILVPLPTAADDHQRVNAREFEAIGASTMLDQSQTSNPVTDMGAQLTGWLGDAQKREQAAAALAEWHLPDATSTIHTLLKEAGAKR